MAAWTLASPDRRVTLTFEETKQGGLAFSAKKDDVTAVADSPLGLKTSLGNFTEKLSLQDKRARSLTERFPLIGAKQALVRAEANELILSFEQAGTTFQLIARAFRDGFAFRYSLQTQKPQTLRIFSEQTAFQIPAEARVYAAPYAADHETLSEPRRSPALGGRYCMPLLYETRGLWALLSEAALTPAYCGACLKGTSTGLMQVCFPPEQEGPVRTETPFFSPWRFAALGTLADIAGNTLPEALSPACVLPDTAWVKPGAAAWTWLNREGTDSFYTYRRYIDLAAEMGWQYLLLDEGWQPLATPQPPAFPMGKKPRAQKKSVYIYDGYYDWTQSLLGYARAKGIGLLAWKNCKDLDSPEKQARLAELAQMGFAGVVPDFFYSQSQETMLLYDQLLRRTAELRLLLYPRGANKPSGERRTWPHCLTREALYGAKNEFVAQSQNSARHNCMLPFTRCAVGPSDFAPMLSYRNCGERRPYTLSHMAALAIVLESGIRCLADRDGVYRNSPAYSLLRDLPASWEESCLLEGEPGSYANFARRNGGSWYIGCICDKPRNAKISLSFLPDGVHHASVYLDGKTPEEIVYLQQDVTNEDSLFIPLAATGGASVKIIREYPFYLPRF